jgi:hypothetical protein
LDLYYSLNEIEGLSNPTSENLARWSPGRCPRPVSENSSGSALQVTHHTHLHANDRQGLERLCRYGARGALAQERPFHPLMAGDRL